MREEPEKWQRPRQRRFGCVVQHASLDAGFPCGVPLRVRDCPGYPLGLGMLPHVQQPMGPSRGFWGRRTHLAVAQKAGTQNVVSVSCGCRDNQQARVQMVRLGLEI